MTELPVHLPPGFTSLVSVGDTVSVGQEIATFTAKVEEVVNIPEELGVSIKKARLVIKKNPGDRVRIGEVLAIKKIFFGFQEEELVSRVNGIVLRYERDTGNLVIRTAGSKLHDKRIISPVDGRVTMCNNERIVINTDKDVYSAKKGIGGKGQGSLFVLEQSFTQVNSDSPTVLYNLDSNAIGKIVFGGKLTREVLMKGVGIGVLGLIGTDISDSDLEYLENRGVHIPIIEIDSTAVSTLKQWKKHVYIDSAAKTVLFLHI